MEKQLFTWDGWDEVVNTAFFFYNPTLIKQIGEFPIGRKFKSAMVDFENGKLEFYDENDDKDDWKLVATFDLELRVVENE
ncbi:hypothetical protein [Scytonema sp. NUACC26]|uniref:hypothetical protein n=1 Tax=Scytonema sp. NUACC26 TaxID=3140176 RepID=UPI0034DBF18C